MTTLIILILILVVENRFRPRLSYVKASNILLLYYTHGTTRKYLILWKETKF